MSNFEDFYCSFRLSGSLFLRTDAHAVERPPYENQTDQEKADAEAERQAAGSGNRHLDRQKPEQGGEFDDRV